MCLWTKSRFGNIKAVRSGVFLAIPLPQPPPEKKSGTGTRIGVACGLLFWRLCFWAAFRPLHHCAAKSAYKWYFAICVVVEMSKTGAEF